MSKECFELHEILKKGWIFNFKCGNKFRDCLEQIPGFSENGIYLMFEKGERGHNGMRIVRIGINNRGILINRLNSHINGNQRGSVFRRHLGRILCGDEDKITEYIEYKIFFCVIRDPNNKRNDLEKKIISAVSNCKECKKSDQWKGLESKKRKIKESGLWNVQHVFGENQLNKQDLQYIKDNILGESEVKKFRHQKIQSLGEELNLVKEELKQSIIDLNIIEAKNKEKVIVTSLLKSVKSKLRNIDRTIKHVGKKCVKLRKTKKL